MLERQRKKGSRRIDLEQRPRTGDDRIRRGLLTDGLEPTDTEALVAPGDLARPAAEPIGPDPDLDRVDTDECHAGCPFRGRSRCRSGHSSDRTFVRLDADSRPNGCSMS